MGKCEEKTEGVIFIAFNRGKFLCWREKQGISVGETIDDETDRRALKYMAACWLYSAGWMIYCWFYIRFHFFALKNLFSAQPSSSNVVCFDNTLFRFFLSY